MPPVVDAVLGELRRWLGWREGPNNDNPFGPEQGVGNHQPYCDSGASMCPCHVGYEWWDDCTYGKKGEAYTVTHVNQGNKYGVFRYDRTSSGDPADVEPGDLTFWDWNGTGQPDHVETAIERRIGAGRIHNIGFNTGSPNGCWETWRDNKYFLGRLRPGYATDVPVPPTPTPQPTWKGNSVFTFRMVNGDIYLADLGSQKAIHLSPEDIDDVRNPPPHFDNVDDAFLSKFTII